MKKLFSLCFIISGILATAGCQNALRQTYVPYSDGLPTVLQLQWKCNPAFGDVNKDGLLDLSALPRKGKGAFVWINKGNGTWSESTEGILHKGSCGGGVDFGDFNNDGLLDLAVGDHCAGLHVYQGDGTGKWTSASNGLPEFFADDIAFGDFNRDGNSDIAACSANDEGARIFTGDGRGNWKLHSTPGLPDSGYCHELAVGDFNHDGLTDIAAMVQQGAVWINTEQGIWRDSSFGIQIPKNGGDHWGVAAGYINNDSHPDLVFGNTEKGTEVYLGDGRGNWRPAADGLSDVQSASGVALADIDGDSNIDLLVSGKKNLNDTEDDYGVFLFKGDGTGNWKLIENSGLPEKGMTQAWGVVLADIDGDGTQEIGGCFGTGSSQVASFLSELTEQGNNPLPAEYFGPRGSIRVWKLH